MTLWKSLSSSLEALSGSGRCSKVPPGPFPLQSEQPELSQPFFTAEVPQPSEHLCDPLLDLKVHVLLLLGAQGWTQCSSGACESRVEGQGRTLSLLLLLPLMQPWPCQPMSSLSPPINYHSVIEKSTLGNGSEAWGVEFLKNSCWKGCLWTSKLQPWSVSWGLKSFIL